MKPSRRKVRLKSILRTVTNFITIGQEDVSVNFVSSVRHMIVLL